MLFPMRTGLFRLAAPTILAVLLVAGVHANPLHDPKRLLNGQTVSLTPLFQWWTNHAGSRPLAAWVHVTGSVVGTNSWGWIIEGRVEHTAAASAADGGSGRVLLRHPPLQDRAEFENLSAQLRTLEEQRAGVAGVEAAAQNRASAISQEQSTYRKYGVRNRALSREDRVVKNTENQAKAELKPIDQQIADLKKQLGRYPNPNQYEVDCFALDTGQVYDRMLLYDYGSALR